MPTVKEFRICAAVGVIAEERLRTALLTNRQLWPALCKVPGINKRYLQAFAKGQLKHPSAYRYLALIEALRLLEESSR